jgi:hypothetical protein
MNQRRFFLGLGVTPGVIAHQPEQDIRPLADRFNHAWNHFYRKLYGCRANVEDLSEFRQSLGTLDYPEFRRCRRNH